MIPDIKQPIFSSCLQGTLFHLPRFYVERRSKASILTHNLVKYLKAKPGCMAPYDEIKEYLNIGPSIKKLMKHSDFQRTMKADLRVPYRTIFPDATEAEWKAKNKGQHLAKVEDSKAAPLEDVEKMVRALFLHKFNLN